LLFFSQIVASCYFYIFSLFIFKTSTAVHVPVVSPLNIPSSFVLLHPLFSSLHYVISPTAVKTDSLNKKRSGSCIPSSCHTVSINPLK